MHGCYRCGTIDGEIEIYDDQGTKCCSCGAIGTILSFQTALDIINDMYLKGTKIDLENYEDGA